MKKILSVILLTTLAFTFAGCGGGGGNETSTTPAILPAPAISYSPTSQIFTVSTAITAIIPGSTGGAVATWSISPTLSGGLAFSNGQITGTPTAARAATTYTVTATNATGSGTATLSITVNSATGDFKVAFVSLGGSLTADQSVVSGGYAAVPATPTRSGYNFSGWYKTLQYDIEWNFSSDVVSANTVIYPKWTRTNPETFAEADRPPVVIIDQGQTYYYGIRLPWNYDKAYNSTRKYPLYIALHSGGGTMSQPTPPNDYPCFVLSPQLPSSVGTRWTPEALAWFVTIIEKVQKDYRIDADRMFIGGFSQGGIGTYQVATALYDYNGQIFASIDRAAGGGGSTDHILPDAALAQTCVHLKIGLKDYAGTVTAIRNAYNLIKDHSSNVGATEITYNHVVTSGTSYQATSWLIVKDGKERVRRTEFPDMGHDSIYDSSRFPWFYNQSIDH